jgi:hypothetical protein
MTLLLPTGNAEWRIRKERSMKKKRVSPENSTGANMALIMQDYIGQPVAILCARFNYRGILSKVCDDCVVLAQARAVESSGASSSERPNSEDPIGSSVIISLNAVELVYQPNWVFHTLDD